MLLQRTAMLVKKLLIDDKINQTNMSPGHDKVLDRKTLPNEKFSFLRNDFPINI